jgi:CDP-paratose 2-epimerase
MNRVVVTGGCGFVGSNVVKRLIEVGTKVTVFDNLSRTGSEENLGWLRNQGTFEFVLGDLRDRDAVASLVRERRVDAIVHLGGQVAMTTSVSKPRDDFEVNVLGTLNVLESLRLYAPEASLVYASSNKVYGNLRSVPLVESRTRYLAPNHPRGLDEDTPLEFRTPYGCSKGAAEQYVLDYAHTFGLRTIVFRHSSVYGSRQFATADQGWVGWFCGEALRRARGTLEGPIMISGDGKQVRDLLFVSDAVDAYLKALEACPSLPGSVFNIGGGFENSSSLIELFEFLQAELGHQLSWCVGPARLNDQRFFVSDSSLARQRLGWVPVVGREAGLRMALEWSTTLY